MWVDVDALEQYVIIGNDNFGMDTAVSIEAFKNAIQLYQGVYLPNRIYEDWSSEEREKIQVLILGAYVTLAELILKVNPLESIRLAQSALAIDATWEDAYRLQMQGYIQKGNRPQALKTYQKCADVLDEEFGIEPLPETRNLLKAIENIR
jgi:DNA-binding SARP family transcriptional activator